MWRWEAPHPDREPTEPWSENVSSYAIDNGFGVTREEIAAGLRPLLELPVEPVLATHGGPTDRAALERALSASSGSRVESVT